MKPTNKKSPGASSRITRIGPSTQQAPRAVAHAGVRPPTPTAPIQNRAGSMVQKQTPHALVSIHRRMDFRNAGNSSRGNPLKEFQFGAVHRKAAAPPPQTPPATPKRPTAAVQRKTPPAPVRPHFGSVIQRAEALPLPPPPEPEPQPQPVQNNFPLIIVIRERNSSTLKNAVGDVEVDDAVEALKLRHGGNVVEYKGTGGWHWSTHVNYIVAHGHAQTTSIGNGITAPELATKLLHSGLTVGANRLKLVVCSTDWKEENSPKQSFLETLVSLLGQDKDKRCRGLKVEGTHALVHYTPDVGSYIYERSVAPTQQNQSIWDQHWEVQLNVSNAVNDGVRFVAVCRAVAGKLKNTADTNAVLPPQQITAAVNWMNLIDDKEKWTTEFKKKDQQERNAALTRAANILRDHAARLADNLMGMRPCPVPSGSWKTSWNKCVQSLEVTNECANHYTELMKGVAAVYWAQKKRLMGAGLETKVPSSRPSKHGVIKFDKTKWVPKIVP